MRARRPRLMLGTCPGSRAPASAAPASPTGSSPEGAAAPAPPAGPPASPAAADPFGLSPREREVLGLLCRRLTDPEIAAALFLSPRTASNHVANVLAKLGAGNRREAAAVAARQGLA